jgi:hypothetical protein
MSKKDQSARSSRDETAGARPPTPPFKAQSQNRPGHVFVASNPDTSYIAGTVPQLIGGETTGG